MKLTEQQFLDSLTADQTTYFNARLIEIRDQFQTSYAASITEVAAAKDQLLIDEKAAHDATRLERDTAVESVQPLQAEIARLTALVPTPLGPRQITAEEFFGRLSPEVVMSIMSNKDPRVVLAVVRLFVRSEAIDLDSDILKGLIQGLVESGVPFDDADLARIFA